MVHRRIREVVRGSGDHPPGAPFPHSRAQSRPREEQTPEYLGKFHKAEIDRWRPIIKAAGIRPQ
jgi:hypothetical protein